MALNLQTVFDDAQRASATNPSDRMGVIKAALNTEGVTRDDVDALLNEATEKFGDLNATDPSDAEGLDSLQILADIVLASRDTVGELDTKAEELRASREELASQVLGDTNAADGEEAPADDEGDEPADAEAEADVVAEAEAATAEAAEAVVASAPAPRPVDLSKISKATPKDVQPDTGDAPRAVITAAADVRNIAQGKHLSMDELTAAAIAKIESMPRPYGVDEVRSSDQSPVVVKAGVGQIRADVPADLVASGVNDEQVIEHAANQKRLKGGSLVASGGWCAPSETIYELSPLLADSNTGLLDVPEIQVKRGGIRTAGGLDFRTVWSGNAGLIQTEAQAIANEEKAVYRPECPSFTETRLDVIYSGLEVGFLQDNAYPEVTKQTVEGVLAVHAHRVNATTIARIEAGSTAVDLSGVGPSAVGSSLNGLELLIADYRYRYRAPESLTLDVVLPIWLKTVIRSDYALRAGIPLEQVTDQVITSWISARGGRVQWVYDWQDAFTGVAGGFGSATAIAAFPTTVKALVYASGTFVRGRGEVVNLDTVYDSTNLKKNDYLKLFMEEKLLVHKRAYQSLVATLPLGVNGATGSGLELDGNGKAA